MKRIFYTTILLIGLSLGAFAQEPVKPLLTKVTATWCPNCGTWGWTAMKDMVDRFDGEKASVLALHPSGDLADDLNIALADNFPVNGQPKFQYNGTDLGFGSSTYAGIMDEMEVTIATETMMINTFNITKSEVTIDELKNNISYSINVVVDASNLDSDDYTLGIYLVRDDIVASQSGQSGEVAHFKILDRAFTENFGIDYNNAGTYTLNATVSTNEEEGLYNYDEHEILAILWNNNGTSYDVVTTETAALSEAAVVSSIDDFSSIDDAKVYVDAAQQINVIVDTYNPSDDIIATLHTVTGRKLDSQVLFQGQAIFPTESLIGSGLYIVTLRSGPSVQSHKISVK